MILVCRGSSFCSSDPQQGAKKVEVGLLATADLRPDRLLYRGARAQGSRGTCSLFAIAAIAEFEFNQHYPEQRHLFQREAALFLRSEVS